MGGMISQTRQRLIMAAMVAVALGAIVLGVIYQDDNRLDEPVIVGAGTSAPATETGGGSGAAGGSAAGVGQASDSAAVGTSAIEGFLPRSGEASACREEVGVDLAAGFGAKLTINGIEIAPEQMNVNLDENGEISEVITASRSLGQYTFKPDDNCPNGTLLRPVDNVLEVCVYRLSDATEACTLRTEKVFDAL